VCEVSPDAAVAGSNAAPEYFQFRICDVVSHGAGTSRAGKGVPNSHSYASQETLWAAHNAARHRRNAAPSAAVSPATLVGEQHGAAADERQLNSHSKRLNAGVCPLLCSSFIPYSWYLQRSDAPHKRCNMRKRADDNRHAGKRGALPGHGG
jgi:hypothetical protein